MIDDTLRFEVICRKDANFGEFVRFWAKLYSYPNGELYDENIGRPLTEESVWNLYRWKNGSNISARKTQAVQSVYIGELQKLPELRSVADGQAYLQRLKGGGIWGIFWLHCIKPELFPIFDQHTYRAMAKIQQLSAKELPDDRDSKLSIYFNGYIDFVKQFSGSDMRDIDKALFAYGRFLKSIYVSA